MKAILACVAAAGLAAAGGVLGQNVTGTVESNGLAGRSETFYVNNLDTINNFNTESVGVAITSTGNVVVGWEDDDSGLTDLGAVWTLYSAGGTPVTPETTVTSSRGGAPITTRFLSYFRANGTAIPGNTSWGPKIKANVFGDGFGMGATSYDLRLEIPEFTDLEMDAGGGGDWPSVQLLTSAGTPLRIVSGVSAADAEPAGDIRIGDWHYLANGNIVIVGESRQESDLVTRFGGAAAGRHVIYRIVSPDGEEVRAVGLVSETPQAAEIWHGVGVTENGFGVRFSLGGRATVRLFDNDGNPTTANLDLGTLTGQAAAAGGGRGDSAGFHGNGKDAYVAVNADTATRRVWLTVLNADGTVRYSKAATDDVPLAELGSTDATIDPAGRVFVVFSGRGQNELTMYSLILGRVFAPDGTPAGGTFYVSELETPELAYDTATDPRISARGDVFAVAWISRNDPMVFGIKEVAVRLFGVAHKPGSIESVGLTRIVPDTPVINPGLNALGNWEPYASVLGNAAFLIEGNTFARDTTDQQRYVVMIQPVAGGAPRMVEGFYADNGQPHDGPINLSRQNGNPGRVAGDPRPGAVNYFVGGETSAHGVPAFQSDNRWNLGFDRLWDGRYATVQGFSLDLATLTPTPLFKAIDAVNSRVTSGVAPGNQITRFGGDIVGLDDGNFVVVADDRSAVFGVGTATTATIIAPDGAIVKESWMVEDRDNWSNVAACQGGFCIRVRDNLHFYNNDGTLRRTIKLATAGAAFDAGRGDGTRIAGHINSPYLYLAGKVSDANIVRVAAWDARNQEFITVADVSEAGFAGDFDRATVAVDALNRVMVSWVSKPPGYAEQQVAARVLVLDPVAKAITPLTASFLPFLNAAEAGGIRTYQMTVAMTTRQLLVAAKGEINLENQPQNGANSPRELNFYTVISHPDPQNDPTPPIGGLPEFTGIRRNTDGSVTLEWTGGGVLESAPAVSGPWTEVTGATSPVTLQPTDAARFGRIRR